MVTSSFLPGSGGIESYLAELLSRLGGRTAVLAPGSRDGVPIPSGLGYPVAGYNGSMLVPTRRVANEIIEKAAEFGTDKILFGTPWPLLLLAPRLRRAGLRYAVIVHGAELILPAAVPGLRGRLARAIAGADAVLPVSAYTEDKTRALVEGAGKEMPPSALLRARVDLDRFSPDADAAAASSEYALGDDPVILSFGRLVERKGNHRLIEALPKVRAEVPDARLVIAGTGPESRRLRRMAGRLPVGSVVFTGRVPDELAPALYARADVFALAVADRWFGLEIEGLGVVLLEAQACGTPCVTGRSGGTPEAVVPGESGLVVDATDNDALAEALAKVLTDPNRRAMGERGREHVRAQFSEKGLPEALTSWLDG